MWKVFGIESDLGKKFYKMYNTDKTELKINYPKIKTDSKKKTVNSKNWNKPKEINKK